MARRHALAHHLVRLREHFLQRGNAGLDGLAGAAGLLHHKGFQARTDVEALLLHQPFDLIALAAEADDQRTGQVGMPGITRHGPPQQIHRFAGHFHAAAGTVGEGTDAVDVRIICKPLRGEIFRDFVRHCRRTVHGCQDAQVIAGRHLAVGADDTHETRALSLRKHFHRFVIAGVSVIAVEFAELEIMRMHVSTGRNVC